MSVISENPEMGNENLVLLSYSKKKQEGKHSETMQLYGDKFEREIESLRIVVDTYVGKSAFSMFLLKTRVKTRNLSIGSFIQVIFACFLPFVRARYSACAS